MSAWVSASEFLRASDRQADDAEAARFQGRLAATRRRVEHENPTLARRRVQEHAASIYEGPSRSPRIPGHLWYATCSCGWHCRKGWRLRTWADASARMHEETAGDRIRAADETLSLEEGLRG